MQFPSDHYTHNCPVEWLYFWGKLSTGHFFHFASFIVNWGRANTRAIHFSLHNGTSQYWEEEFGDFFAVDAKCGYLARGNRFYIGCKQFDLVLFPQVNPIIHQVKLNRNYYSIPHLVGEGYLYPGQKVTVEAWLDHEFSDIYKFKGWDWVGIKLNCGVSVMVYSGDVDSFCTVNFGDKLIHPDFTIEKEELLIPDLGMHFYLKPKVDESIFHPKFGVPYSEQPLEVVSNDKVIGIGMRERTHRGEENG